VTLAFLLGVLAGLRSLSAPAVVAWGARLGWLQVAGPLAWIALAEDFLAIAGSFWIVGRV
jgi:uncharacterized membrane protein